MSYVGALFPLLLLIVVVAVVLSSNPIYVELPTIPEFDFQDAPESADWYMEQVMPWPAFVTPAVTYTPGPETQMYLLPEEMPPLPDCRDLGIEDCKWEAHNMHSPSGDMIQVELKSGNGKVMGRTELLKIQTYETEELNALTRMGYNEAWIARIEVMNILRGNGLGRLMWRAGDAALKAASGGGVVRVFSDRAGWGHAIMKLVPKHRIILEQPPIWVYIIE